MPLQGGSEFAFEFADGMDLSYASKSTFKRVYQSLPEFGMNGSGTSTSKYELPSRAVDGTAPNSSSDLSRTVIGEGRAGRVRSSSNSNEARIAFDRKGVHTSHLGDLTPGGGSPRRAAALSA